MKYYRTLPLPHAIQSHNLPVQNRQNLKSWKTWNISEKKPEHKRRRINKEIEELKTSDERYNKSYNNPNQYQVNKMSHIQDLFNLITIIQ